MVTTRSSSYVKYYLVVYNVVSALGWYAILVLSTAHLLDCLPVTLASRPSLVNQFFRFFSSLKNGPISPTFSKFQVWVHNLLQRAETTYAVVGTLTKWVQTAAVLEVVHVLLRWVRSPPQTTAMQIASRLILVWGVVDRFHAAQSNPIYASLVLSWSITEVIRYSFYAYSLLRPSVPHALVYLRYTTFYVLYPTGASSEAFLILATLPRLRGGWGSPFNHAAWPGPALALQIWGWKDFVRAALFVFWWPGLYVMYMHMIGQRRKILAPGRTTMSKKWSKKWE